MVELATFQNIIENIRMRLFSRNKKSPPTTSRTGTAAASPSSQTTLVDDDTEEIVQEFLDAGTEQIRCMTPVHMVIWICLEQKVQVSTQLQEERLPLNSERLFAIGAINASSVQDKKSLTNEKWILDLMLSLQVENQQILDKLSQIDSSHQYFDDRHTILNLIVVEKCKTLEEQEEQNAILSCSLHRDFYILLQQKLKCMIKSCETLSAGMVGVGYSDLWSFTAQSRCLRRFRPLGARYNTQNASMQPQLPVICHNMVHL